MPAIHTHLNLAQRLMKTVKAASPEAFLLGSAYPDRFGQDLGLSLRLHYKKALADPCDLCAFLDREGRDDFAFGYYFHLWTDNYMLSVDPGDITKMDCRLCDMERIRPIIRDLQGCVAQGKAQEALGNILALDDLPLARYVVPEEKKNRYGQILEEAVAAFIRTSQF